jgi:hypothetical protein
MQIFSITRRPVTDGQASAGDHYWARCRASLRDDAPEEGQPGTGPAAQ